MQANRQATFSFLFFIGSLLISVIIVPGIPEASGSTQKKLVKDVPLVSQNINSQLIRLINKNVISDHLDASYRFLSMSIYFGRADVALPGFSKYFRKLSDRKLENANFLMSYLNKRGGYVELRTVEAPTRNHWLDGLDAMYTALEIEKSINGKLLHLQKQAAKHEDPHVTHTVEDKLLDPTVDLIKEIGDHITNLSRMMGENYGLGEYMFDKDL
ncbi:ferritin light chain, oocyte isoform-like [Mercenaria mercenaria]|uniref:ferritin light chain, oocyte isoform-like n=1 Tax=Mercenaria mercenaria TaxID=6596 RepID=UPI00234E7F79|nr:ferritin light chain, oocyte isoform-like [Mercenaria mercenaria]